MGLISRVSDIYLCSDKDMYMLGILYIDMIVLKQTVSEQTNKSYRTQ